MYDERTKTNLVKVLFRSYSEYRSWRIPFNGHSIECFRYLDFSLRRLKTWLSIAFSLQPIFEWTTVRLKQFLIFISYWISEYFYKTVNTILRFRMNDNLTKVFPFQLEHTKFALYYSKGAKSQWTRPIGDTTLKKTRHTLYLRGGVEMSYF